MSLRIGFDLDGVLADFASAFHDVEAAIFGVESPLPAGQPENGNDLQRSGDAADSAARRIDDPYEVRRRREAVWAAIESTPDFWTTLKPTDEGAVRRIHALMLRHHWEVFFITQRPGTAGETVQRQTQRWLVGQGFDLPSVLVIPGSRGAAATALRLDFHVDDSPQNCIDVMTESGARTILVSADGAQVTDGIRKLGIATASGIDACLDILEQATVSRDNPSLFRRLATMVGWGDDR